MSEESCTTARKKARTLKRLFIFVSEHSKPWKFKSFETPAFFPSLEKHFPMQNGFDWKWKYNFLVSPWHIYIVHLKWIPPHARAYCLLVHRQQISLGKGFPLRSSWCKTSTFFTNFWPPLPEKSSHFSYWVMEAWRLQMRTITQVCFFHRLSEQF